MKNTETTDNYDFKEGIKIKYINQRVYEAVDKFGEIIPVKIIDEYFNYYSAGSLENYLEEYDFNGNLVKKTIFNLKNKICKIFSYLYEDNLLIEEKYEKTDIELELIYKHKYEYNSLRKIQSLTEYDFEDKMERKSIYKYKNDGLLDEINLYDSEGFFYKRLRHAFNVDNNLIQRDEYNKKGICIYIEKFSYSENILLQYSKINRESQITEETKIYNKNGGILIDFNGYSSEYYVYNENEFMTKYIKIKYDLKIDCLNEYMINNLPEKSNRTDIIEYTYETDNNGNWINKIHFRNSIPIAITTREIEYY